MMSLLGDWDGFLDHRHGGSALFQFFLSEISKSVMGAKAPRSVEWATGKGFHLLAPITMYGHKQISQLCYLLKTQPEGWWPHPNQDWESEIRNAFFIAWNKLEKKYGTDTGLWAWGKIRPRTLEHGFGKIPGLGKIFNRGPMLWGGDNNTVSQSAMDLNRPTLNPFVVASLRMVIDVGNWDENSFALPGGQSGNPLSPHYDDQLPLWYKGEGFPILWSESKIEKETKTTLILTPSTV